MKKIFLPLAVTLFLTGTIFVGCESSAQKVENAEQGVAAAQANLDQARKDSVAAYEKQKVEWNAQIARNEKVIADYKVTVAKEKKEVRARDEERLDKMQQKNEALKVSVDEYNENGKQTWADFKAGFKKMTDEFDDDMTEFGKSLGKALDKK